MTVVPSVAELGPNARYWGAFNLEQCFRFLLPGSPATIAPGYLTLVTGAPHPFGNFGLVSEADDLGAVQKVVGALSTCSAPCLVGFHTEPSTEITNVLTEHGFGQPDPMPILALDIHRLAPTQLPPGYRFASAGPSEADSWTRAISSAFGLPEEVARYLSPHRTPDKSGEEQVHFFGVFRDDRVVATTGLYLNGKVAGIYSVGTIAEERGKGLGAHVTAESLRFAANLGYKVGVLQSSTAGYPVYKRIGFQDLGTVPLYFRGI